MDDLNLFGFLNESKAEVKHPKLPISEVKAVCIPAPPDHVVREIVHSEFGDGSKRTIHETVYPLSGIPQDSSWRPHDKPAKSYAYTLDPFQAKSVECLEMGQSVLVSAHTSAGKTAVAEYAVAMALREKQRVIYTAPIKALSNQKYRDLQLEFGDVGLMTGDITISPNASCLVMTTEILRSIDLEIDNSPILFPLIFAPDMLYRGNEILREVAWVVFDEVHYMRDNERGVVWEESIIMLPDKVRYVFLSATIPNGSEFASWVADIHQQVIHVITTEYRPTPLKYYVFKEGGDGAYLVMDERKEFLEDNFQKALASEDEGAAKTRPRYAPPARDQKKFNPPMSNEKLREIINGVMTLRLGPIIVFSFSRKMCESYSKMMSQQSYTTNAEKEFIRFTFNLAVQRLSDEDRLLPQIQDILPLIENGVAMHHSGLLPIVKEIVETLFSARVIKVLFATETFAMGINMPAKTVIFSKVDKFDGTDIRMLTSGEYIQMSGRAGRRGMDKYGVVIQLMNKKVVPAQFRAILLGTAAPLDSSFYVRIFHPFVILDPQEMRRLEADLFASTEKLKQIHIAHEEDTLAQYWVLKKRVDEANDDFWSYLSDSSILRPFLSRGRLVQVVYHSDNYRKSSAWGCILTTYQESSQPRMPGQFLRNGIPELDGDEETTLELFLRVLLLTLISFQIDSKHPETPFCFEGENGDRSAIIKVPLSDLCSVSLLSIDVPPSCDPDLTMSNVQKKLEEYKSGLPLIHPILDVHVFLRFQATRSQTSDPVALSKYDSITALISELSQFDVDPAEAVAYLEKKNLEATIEDLKSQLKENQDSSLMVRLTGHSPRQSDTTIMKTVMERLGYLNSDGIVTIKGKLMCDLTCRNEVLVTELVFENVMSELTIPQVCALLTVITSENKSSENEAAIPSEMKAPMEKLMSIAERIVTTEKEAGLSVDVPDYLMSISTDMVDIMFRWSQGESSIALFTENPALFEGAIVKMIRSTDDLLRKLAGATKLIGNLDMEEKFLDCQKAIKRDIAFLNSLYVDNEGVFA